MPSALKPGSRWPNVILASLTLICGTLIMLFGPSEEVRLIGATLLGTGGLATAGAIKGAPR